MADAAFIMSVYAGDRTDWLRGAIESVAAQTVPARLYICADGVLPPEAATFELLHEETLRLAELVEDVLRLARADAARGRLHLSAFDLVSLVDEVRGEFAARLTERGLRVRQHAPRALRVQADKARIRRVLRNLLDNAVRYAPQSGRLDVRIAPSEDRVRVTLENSADEVRDADLPLLFERFFRGEKSRSRKHGGAGIGLSIVKELVEAHGGRVGAERRANRLHVWFELPAFPTV